ncbi:MAG TPA: metalloregulator ArsR/SmtB family transcription factor [Flavitalea sp.]|nr:metalloregulator ArsR/SmtB family transcription factor [Flavitalea sp.]
MNKREFKDKVYSELAKVAKAMANPHRLEIIDLLAQGPCSVEQLANYTGMSVANASQHLQTLKNAKLVQISRSGNFINYSLTSEDVFFAWAGLRELGLEYNAEAQKLIRDFRKGYKSNMNAVDADELARMIEKDEIILLDVRPEVEYKRGHIHSAMSIPIEKLEAHIKKLPKRKMIVAYCRGPFCFFADEAVALLQKKGFNAVRMDKGFPEWVDKGYPVENAQTIN